MRKIFDFRQGEHVTQDYNQWMADFFQRYLAMPEFRLAALTV
jgi:hypothetical protein